MENKKTRRAVAETSCQKSKIIPNTLTCKRTCHYQITKTAAAAVVGGGGADEEVAQLILALYANEIHLPN